MCTWENMYNTQYPSSISSICLMMLHDYTLIIMLLITLCLIYILIIILSKNPRKERDAESSSAMEFAWTLLPMILIMLIAYPSILILYFNEDLSDPLLSIKAIGHQWYWSYEYPEFSLSFDSFMKNSNLFRLMDTDNRMVAPFLTQLRISTSSMDVIHSWTIPSFGIKMDAVPGRINQHITFIWNSGIFFGQCSEICGMNHSFMPIVAELTDLENFINWIKHMSNM